MPPQTLPRSAETYAHEQRAEIRDAVTAVKRQWRRVGTEFDAGFLLVAPTMLAITDQAQARVAEAAQAYIPAVLGETGQARAVEPRLEVRADSLVGTAGDGLPTETLLYGAVTHAKVMVGEGASTAEALASSSKWLSLAVGTLLSDTGRASETLAVAARPVSGWVRMLNPPSCGRCVVLAGKWYRRNQGFLRHPGCDCRHVPASESVAGDLTVDPRAYFDSLDEAAQAKLMGSKANAAAVRDFDADMGQLVNAYRKKGGVRTAQVYGHTVKYTTEGTTRRGAAYRAMSATRGGPKAPRLMPESIAQIAADRADEARLLRLYGWVL